MTTPTGTPAEAESARIFSSSPWAAWTSLLDREDVVSTLLLWGIRLAVVLLFATPLVVTTSTVFPFIVGKAVWSRSLIEVVVGLYILLALRAPEYRPRRSPLIFLLGAHLLALLIAGYFGSSLNLSLWSSYERMGGLIDLLHWYTLIAVLMFAIRGFQEWKILIGVYLLVSWAPMIVALAENFNHQITGYVPIGRSGGRIGSMAGNPAFLGGQMMINMILALALLASLDWRRVAGDLSSPSFRSLSAVFLLLTAVFSGWVLFETGTRGAMAGLAAGFAVAAGAYALFSKNPRVRIPIIFAGLAVPLAVILLFIARDTQAVQNLAERSHMVNRIVSVSLDEKGLASRTAGMRIAVKAFADRPLTGWGGENFEVPFHLYQQEGEFSDKTPNLDRAHNKPLDLLATSGLIGFGTYMALWAWLGWLAWRRVRSEPDARAVNGLLFGGLVALFINDLFIFETVITLLPFVMVAVWAAMSGRGDVAPKSVDVSKRSVSSPIRRSLDYAAPVVVAIALVVLVYGVNMRIFRAAQLITQTGSSVEEVVSNLDHFPPLSAFGRERLLNVMSDRWESVDHVERFRLLPILVEQGDKALDAEPDNMNLHFAVANFYRTAADGSANLLEKARFHTDAGVELGPKTAFARIALADQEAAEAALENDQPG